MPRTRRITVRAFRIKLKKETIYSIGQVVFFSLAGLIILTFTRQGLVLTRLNDFLLHLFSWTAIFLPFLFLVSGLLISKFKTPLNQANVLIGSLLFVISFGALTSAGVFGRELNIAVATLITPIGAFLIFSGGVVIGLIVFFNTSLDQVIALFIAFLAWIRRFILGISQNPVPKTSQIRVQQPQLAKKVKDEQATQFVPEVSGEEKIWQYPPLSLLSQGISGKADRGDIKQNAQIIEKNLESFGISAHVVEVNLGPAVTQYAIEVALGTKLSKITALERDLALALAAPTGTIRIEAPIPGRSLVGIELPNKSPEFVGLRQMLESDEMRQAKSKLALPLGLDVSGKPVIANLERMPHILIAGQTGSGKSVALNSFIAAILFRASPQEVKFILVDPKRVELTGYNGIPHLLSPVIVEPEKVVSALNWILKEMDNRYKLFAQVGVRNIEGYNEMSGFQSLPYIVVIVDELADIMLYAPVEVEDAITRIAQMSRATGIHMIISTQRPSVDIITGLIKANIPCRIAFAVASQVDSRVILDVQGAEKLLGRGDMLYIPPDQAKPTRIQGTYVADADLQKLIEFLKKLGVAPQYTEEVTTAPVKSMAGEGLNKDELFEQAVRIICQYDRASASLLQRRLSIGYARAARILDQLQEAGVVGPAEGSKPRDVLVRNPEEFLAKL